MITKNCQAAFYNHLCICTAGGFNKNYRNLRSYCKSLIIFKIHTKIQCKVNNSITKDIFIKDTNI